MYEPFIVINPISVSLQPSVILTNIKQENTIIKTDEVHVQVKSFIESPKTQLQLFFVQDKDSTLIKDTTVDLQYNAVYDFNFSH